MAEGAARAGPGWLPAPGPATTTVLLRHGETGAGLKQAAAAAARLAARGGLDLIVTSPLERARRTAGAVGAAPPGGESFAATADRVLAALGSLLAERPEATVLVVSHVTQMKILLLHALLAPSAALRRVQLDVACLCEIDWYAGGAGVVRSVKDTAHLSLPGLAG